MPGYCSLHYQIVQYAMAISSSPVAGSPLGDDQKDGICPIDEQDTHDRRFTAQFHVDRMAW
jgi:hypothetical protein